MMRGTYQVIHDQKEREREKESALENNILLQQKITQLQEQLKEANAIILDSDNNKWSMELLNSKLREYQAKYKKGGV